MPDPTTSAQFTVNGSPVTGEIAVAAGSTVDLALVSTFGISTIEWSFIGSHDPDVVNPTITVAGYPSGTTASFVMPATAGDQGFVLQCKVNGGRDITGALNSSYTATALIGVAVTSSGVAFSFNEAFERGLYGYVPKLNLIASGAVSAVNASKAANHEVTAADWGDASPAASILRVLVTAAATITLPDDSSRAIGTTIMIGKDEGSHVLTISGNGASLQYDEGGQSFTSYATAGTNGRSRSEWFTFCWNGEIWTLLGRSGGKGERVILSSSRDALLSDAGKVLHCDGGTVVYTVNADTFDDGDEVTFLFTGSSGSLTIATGTGPIAIQKATGKELSMSTRYTWTFLHCYGGRGDTPQEHVLSGELDATP